MSELLKLLNDARIRSVIAGGIGGLLGWFIAQVLFGEAASTVETLAIGLVVGLGIATVLGAAEGVVLRSTALAKRGALIGLAVGSVGGMVGAALGQFSYTLASASPVTDSAGSAPAGRSFFSPAMRQRFEEAGALVGTIEIGLSWEDRNDLDLHVFDPTGEHVYFENKVARSGGKLDVDRNVSPDTNQPVEHVVWENQGPPGRYRIMVDHFKNHVGEPTESTYRVEMVVNGEFKEFRDTIRAGQRMVPVHEFELGDEPPQATGGFSLLELLAVVLGWTFFGAFVGIAEGFRRRSSVAFRNAAIGGTIGGALGGLALAFLATGSAVAGRALGFVILGACIGLWIVLIDRAFSAALSIRNGRHEGRHIILDKPLMRLGRNDSLEVYLGGDREIASHHASISHELGGHTIEAVDATVLVNGLAVDRQPLMVGDTIVVGETRMVYKRSQSNQEGETSPVKTSPRKTTPPPPSPKRLKPPAKPSNPGTGTTTQPPAEPQASPRAASENRQTPPPPPPRKK